jgi:hypothetical protein
LFFKKWPFNRATIQHAPDDPGVIALWDGEEVIYLGHAREGTIRAALLHHHDSAADDCTRKATHYSWEITARPAARESELLKAFAERYGRVPRCQPKAA